MGNSRYPMEELVPVVAKLAFRMTGGESTSVSYERAQQLIEAVLYCLQAYETDSGNGLEGQKIPAEEAWRIGYRRVTEKVLLLKECYHAMLPDFCDYGVACLRDVVQEGIPAFFRVYDPQFCPQDTVLTMDYPVLCEIAPGTGVDAVYAYVSCIAAEQRFLAGFAEGYVRRVLQDYQEDRGALMENICAVLLPNVLGHLLLHKPLGQEGFTEEELERLGDYVRGPEETKTFLKNVVARMVAQRYNGEQGLADYLCGEVENIAVRMAHYRENGCLKRLFFR